MKKVLSLWKVIVLIFATMIGVAGGTALTLYLIGDLDDEIIEPENIYFEKTLAEGDGFYNSDLSCYEVASDSFKMLISSTTEGVTEKKVTLSLVGQGNVVEGYISDGVIKVPQEVEIGKAFTVTLEQTFDNSLDKYLVMGGTSILTAKSSNVLLSPQTVKIAVDCPVDSINVNVAHDDSVEKTNAELQSVVVGESFTLDVDFLPENSQYLFSDNTREKEIFYNFTKAYISYDWESNKFTANTKSAKNYDTITLYTFKNSYYQQQILQTFSYITNREELTSAVLRYFEENPETYVSKSINVKVDSVGVSKFEMKGGDKTFENLAFDKYYTITTNSSTADATLSLIIEDANGKSLSSLYSNVGLRLPTTSEDFNALSIEGGKLMKVEFLTGVELPRITKLENANGITDWNVNAEGVEKTYYYLLPNASPKFSSDYYWKVSVISGSNEDVSFDLEVNFFYENAEGELVSFCGFDADSQKPEQKVMLKASGTAQGIEESIGWDAENQAGIALTINFDENGTAQSDDIDLEDYIGIVPSTNLYQTLKYFLVLPAELEADETFNIHDYFVCEVGKEYTNDYQGNALKISNVDMHNDVYTLYEIQGSVLTAKKSFSGNILVVAATVKSKADGSLYDDDGKYVVVKMTTGKEITVASSLSIANMTPTFKITDEEGRVYEDAATGNIFVPVIAKNNSGSDIDLVKFNLTLANCETFDTDYNSNSDVSKVLKAFADKSLRLECLSGITVADYVTLESLQLAENGADVTNKIATFEGVLKINKSLIPSRATRDVEGTPISLRLIYEDGTNTYAKDVLTADGKTGFNIYYQQVCEIEGAFENDNSKKDGDGYYPISVDVSTDGTLIKWGNEFVEAISLEELNQSLTFDMLDQFGKTVRSSDGVYKIKFEETTDKNVLSFNSDYSRIQNFNTTNGQVISTTLNVYVVSVDGNGNETKVGKFDEDGNLIYGEDGELEYLSSPTLTLNISSESIKEVWYDAQRADSNIAADRNSAVWTKSSSTSTVVIQRYVTANDSFVLDDVVRMYASEVEGATAAEKAAYVMADTSEYYQGTEFYFDTTFLAGLTEARGVMLSKMFSEISVVGEETPEDVTNIKNYSGYQISSVKFAYPFTNENIELIFKATGKDGALFDVTIKLVILPDLTINTSAFNEYETKYEDYLVSEEVSGNKIRIFAGQTFDLDSYAMLSSFTGRAGGTSAYSWTTLITGLGVENCTSVDSSDDAEIIKLVNNGKYALVVGDVYNYKNLIVSLYYGYKTDYSCSITLQFYVQPNLVVRQMNGYDADGNGAIEEGEMYSMDGTATNLDVSLVQSGASIVSYYKFYRLVSDDTRNYVGYLDANGEIKGFADDGKISIDGSLTYTNETTTLGRYIQISEQNVVYADGANKIDFNQGQTYAQSFYVTYENGGVRVDRLKAVRVVEGETPQVIINPDGVRFEFNLGLGTDLGNLLTYSADLDGDDKVDLDEDGKEKKYPVKTITYNSQQYVLLAPNATYNLATGYKVDEVSGLIRKSGLNAIATNGLTSGYVNYEANEFVLSQTFQTDDDTLTATILLKAFVSGLGENLVYYNNGEGNLKNMEYNNFEYDVFDAQGNKTGTVDVDLNDILQLKDSNVYQNVTAGQTYTVVHNSDIALTEGTKLKDAIGFYFSEETAKAYSGELSTGRINVKIYEDALGLATLSKANLDSDYETLLSIKPLDQGFAEDYGDIFVTLKLEIYKIANASDAFVWYYRVKVNPNYTLDEVKYPYATNAEYLTETHTNYDGEKYVVNLEENFNATNSDYTSGSRFAIPVAMEGVSEITNLIEEYAITKIVVYNDEEKVYSTDEEIASAIKTYFKTLNVSEGVFTAQSNSTAKIDVVVTKTYKTGNVEMMGSARDYVFKLNQGGIYTHTISASIDGAAAELISKENDTAILHNQTLTADRGEVVYTTTIKADAGNNLYTNVDGFGAYVKALNGASLSDALTPIAYNAVTGDYSYKGGEYTYSVSAGTVGYLKQTTTEVVYLFSSPEKIEFSDEYVSVTFGENEVYIAASDIGSILFDGQYHYSISAGKDYYVPYITPVEIVHTPDTALDLTQNYASVKDKIEGVTQTIYIKSNEIKESTIYYYMDEDSKLHFTPLSSVAKDVELEIGYYVKSSLVQTDVIPRVVFTIDVDLNSYFVYELNTPKITEGYILTGGEEYSLYDEGNLTSSIFSKLHSMQSGTAEDVGSFDIQLLNGDDAYYVESDEYYLEGVTLADLVCIDETNKTIEFANMPKSATFNFKGIINQGEADEYTFAFSIVVSPNVDLSAQRLIDVSNGTERYSNVEFNVATNELTGAYGFENSDADKVCFSYGIDDEGVVTYEESATIIYPTYVDKTTYPTQGLELLYVFNGKTIFDFIVNYKYKVAPSVEVENYHPVPDGTTEIEAEYISTTQTDGDFVATVEDFFNTSAVFSDKNRIEVAHIAKGEDCDTAEEFIKNIGENWTISVSSITNMEINVSGSAYNANIVGDNKEETFSKSFSGNGTILENALVKGENAYTKNEESGEITISRPIVNLDFKVVNSNSNGTAEFAVTVNGITTIYKVVINVGSAYEVVLNQPNYTNNQELIYAEDLTSQELNIFAQDRIASFTTKTTVATGNYVLRLVNKTNTNEIQTPTITIDNKGALTNIDLGKSYSNYYYDGTYISETLAKIGNKENQQDSVLYENGLSMTDRIVVKYADVEIKFVNTDQAEDEINLYLKERITIKENGEFTYKGVYNEETGTYKYDYADLDRNEEDDEEEDGKIYDILAGDYKVYEGFYAQPTTLEIYLKLGNEEKDLNAIYTYYIDIEFAVEGTADNLSNYTTYELEANGGLGTSQTPYQLMDLVNIYNKRTNAAYGTTGLSSSSGAIDLKLYGFSDLTVSLASVITIDKAGQEYVARIDDEKTRLKAVAGYIHKMLQTTEDENGIVYHTGLIPNYNMNTINQSGITSNSYENFISIAGSEVNSKTVDYKIFAHASNNDGNHVMMRLAYTVDIDGGDTNSGLITKYFNLLFKVIPNSTFKFESGHETGNFIEGADEIIDGQSVVTNYQQVYAINGDKKGTEITLWSANSGTTSSILAQMYGSKSNTAHQLTYTITLKDKYGSTTYNDWDAFKTWLNSNSSYWTAEEDGLIYVHNAESVATGELCVDPQSISLGSREYMIEIENAYGYRARFYYKYVADTNPQIESVGTSTTLTENTNLAFASKYYDVSPTYVTGDSSKIEFNSFEYKAYDNEGYFADKIYAKGYTGDITATITLQVVTDGSTESVKYSRTISGTKEKKDEKETGNATYSIWGDDSVEWSATGCVNKTFASREAFYDALVNNHHITLSIDASDASTKTYSFYYADKYVTDETNWYLVDKNGTVDASEAKKNPTISDWTADTVSSKIKQSYTIASTATTPQVAIGEEGALSLTSTVLLAGLDAYAFENLVDANSISEELVSDVNNVKVKTVDFYYNNEWIGGSWATEYYSNVFEEENKEKLKLKSTENDENSGGGVANIITTNEKFFINNKTESSVNITEGQTGNSSDVPKPLVFKVPYIEGALFGSGDVLNGVTMRVTLTEGTDTTDVETEGTGTSAVEAGITTIVNIKRQASTEDMFASKNIRDAASPEKKTEAILNDTLEVVLPANESTTFMVHDKEIVYTNWDAETKTVTHAIDIDGNMFVPKLVTLSNVKSYAVTEYVGISASIVDLEANLNTGDHKDFYIYDFESSDNVKFNYNGDSVAVSNKTEESKELTWLASSSSIKIAEETKTVDGKSVTSIVDKVSVTTSKVAYLAFVKSTEAPKLKDYSNLNFKEYSSGTHEIVISDLVGDISKGDTVYIIERKVGETAITDLTYNSGSTSFEAVKYQTCRQRQGEIAGYDSDSSNALIMNINNVDELNSSFNKTETLHFMLAENGKTYRFVETFTIYPQFTLAQELAVKDSTKTATNERYQQDDEKNCIADDNKFTVSDYMEVDNALGKYYLIPLSVWAKDIVLTNEDCDIALPVNNASFATLSNSGAYKFYYKINSTLGGSAFIDENGLITTTTNYDLETHQMSVDVFMKVSGNDGKYQENNTTIHIGTFIINLDPNVSGFTNDGNKHEGSFIVNGDIVTLGTDSLIAQKDTCPSLTAFADTEKLTDSTQYSYLVGTTVDFEDMFGHMTLGSVDISELTNRNYHIVYDSFNAPDPYIYYGNLNSWTFTTTGVHKIDVVVTGRNSSGTAVHYLIDDITILIYDTTINERESFDNDDEGEIAILKSDGTVTHTLGSGYDWYLKSDDGTVTKLEGNSIISDLCSLISFEYNNETIDYSQRKVFGYSTSDNSVKINLPDGVSASVWLSDSEITNEFMSENEPTEITNSDEVSTDKIVYSDDELQEGQVIYIKIKPNGIMSGVFEKEYLAANTTDDSIKNVKYTYYIYGDKEDRTVALQKYEVYNLSQLADDDGAKYTFYDKESFATLTSVSFEYGEHTAPEKQILMHRVDSNGNQSLKLINLTVKIIGSSVTEKTLEVRPSDSILELVKGKIVSTISGLTNDNCKAVSEFNAKTDGKYTHSNVWTLEVINGYSLTDATTASLTTDNTKYLVTYRNSEGITKFYRFLFTFYEYEGKYGLDWKTTADNSFELSSLNSVIRQEVGVADNSVSVRYFKLIGEKLTEVIVVDAEVSSCDTYLVQVGTNYYKFDILIYAKIYDIYLETVSEETVKKAVLATLNITDLSKEVKYYNLNNSSGLVETNANSVEEEFFALISGSYYKFKRISTAAQVSISIEQIGTIAVTSFNEEVIDEAGIEEGATIVYYSVNNGALVKTTSVDVALGEEVVLIAKTEEDGVYKVTISAVEGVA